MRQSDFVVALMASASSTPTQPSAASLALYSSTLVQINWTNAAGGYQTKVYRKTPFTNSVWTFVTTIAAGTALYQTGDTASTTNYTYGVSHFNPGNGQESDIRTAVALLPPTPSGSITNY